MTVADAYRNALEALGAIEEYVSRETSAPMSRSSSSCAEQARTEFKALGRLKLEVEAPLTLLDHPGAYLGPDLVCIQWMVRDTLPSQAH